MRQIDDALRSGEQNRDTMELVCNWCAHARLKKVGGTGMVEATTGLPIGPHMIACDFAPAGGFASWDLRDSALDFYDRNCSACGHRRPVGLPNLTELVAERDRARSARDDENAASEKAAADALAARASARAALRSALSPVACTIVDDIDAFDRDRSTANFARIAQSAMLAPERFEPPLVDYLFELGERDLSFADMAMTALDIIKADDQRLARLAVATLEEGALRTVGATILRSRLGFIDDDAVGKVLSAAIDEALFDDTEFFYLRGDDEPGRKNHPDLLIALYGQFPSAVLDGIERLMRSGRRREVEAAGRALIVLQSHASNAAAPLLRTLVSIYVRADSLVGDLKVEGDRLPHLADALNLAFEHVPNETDDILQQILIGATPAVRLRAYKVYALALDVGWDSEPVPATSERHRIAFRRLIWASTTELDEECAQEICDAFRSGNGKLRNVVRSEFDALIGALLLLADRLAAIDAEQKPANEPFLDTLARRGRRSAYVSILSNLVEWGGEAALGDETLIRKLVGLLDDLPDGRDELRGLLLGVTKKLAMDLAGLRLVLPHLYHALVGPSALVRAYAATAVGDLPHRARANIPDLVFDAFGVLLWDQYVAVHKSAVGAFRFGTVPEDRVPGAGRAILNLIHHYRTESGEDRFVAECLAIAAGMIESFGKSRDAVRRYLVQTALTIDPMYLSNELSRLRYSLGEEPDFAKLVARAIPQMAGRGRRDDGIARLLAALPSASIRAHQDEFCAAAKAVVHDDLIVALHIIEAIARAGAPEVALDLADRLTANFEDTKHSRSRRSALQHPAMILRFEAALAAGDTEAVEARARDWEERAAADQADAKDNDERRNRSNLPRAH